MKRRQRNVVIIMLALLLSLCFLTGCGQDASDEKIAELETKLSEADERIDELTSLLEEANQTVEALNSAAENGGLVLKKVEGVVAISSIKYQTTYTDIPYYSTANEANQHPYDMGDSTTVRTVSFYVDGLEKASNISCTITSDSGYTSEPDPALENGVYIFAKKFSSGAYLIKVSYELNEVPCEFYFTVSFSY